MPQFVKYGNSRNEYVIPTDRQQSARYGDEKIIPHEEGIKYCCLLENS